jgi:hypothetical protein
MSGMRRIELEATCNAVWHDGQCHRRGQRFSGLEIGLHSLLSQGMVKRVKKQMGVPEDRMFTGGETKS